MAQWNSIRQSKTKKRRNEFIPFISIVCLLFLFNKFSYYFIAVATFRVFCPLCVERLYFLFVFLRNWNIRQKKRVNKFFKFWCCFWCYHILFKSNWKKIPKEILALLLWINHALRRPRGKKKRMKTKNKLKQTKKKWKENNTCVNVKPSFYLKFDSLWNERKSYCP